MLRGRVPRGEVVLPRPLYSRIERVERGDGAAIEVSLTSDGRALIFLEDDAEITVSARLDEAPAFHDGPVHLAPPAMLERTAPDDELPRELLDWLEALLSADPSPLARALRIRDLVRERYRYDPSYLEDDRVARWLQRATERSQNAHLSALHAGRSSKHLGAGVCYELNALCCELMRRAGVPAALCAGWALSGDQVDEPDHLWAVALLPSDLGPRLLPIDAAATREGAPLTVPRRPSGAFAPPRASGSRPPPAPAWARQQPQRPQASGDLPVAELARVARYLARQQGQGSVDEGTLRRRLRALLDDPEQARKLLELLRG